MELLGHRFYVDFSFGTDIISSSTNTLESSDNYSITNEYNSVHGVFFWQ